MSYWFTVLLHKGFATNPCSLNAFLLQGSKGLLSAPRETILWNNMSDIWRFKPPIVWMGMGIGIGDITRSVQILRYILSILDSSKSNNTNRLHFKYSLEPLLFDLDMILPLYSVPFISLQIELQLQDTTNYLSWQFEWRSL